MLVDMVNQGSFAPNVRHDILIEEIITKEHDGRVCGVGQGINMRLYFRTSRKSNNLRKKEIDELVYKKLA